MSFSQPPFWAYDRGGIRGWPQHVGLTLVTPPAIEPLSASELRSQVKLDDSAGEPLPATAPTIALAGLGAGVVENGVHRVAVSYVTADGETPPGPLSAPVTVVDKTVNGKLAVSAIPAGGSAVTTIKLWMPLVGTVAPLFFAGSVANGVAVATINLADVGLGVQAPAVNTTADPELAQWGIAARMDTEIYTGCAWITQGVDLTLSRFPLDRRAITIPIRPLISISGIDYLDASGVAQTLDPTLYVVDAPNAIGGVAQAGRVMLAYGTFFWPFPPAMEVQNGVTIHCQVGYGAAAAAVPATAKTAMKLLVGNWWQNREAGQIVRGSADVLPYGVDRVLDPFRLESVA
jgi:uncharacterized phiE125 gp8 family phage protein